MPAPTPLPSSFDTHTSFKEWVKGYEKFRDKYQIDDVNKQSIVGGYGHDVGSKRRDLIDQPVSQADGDRWLDEDIAAKTKAVKRLVNPYVWDRMAPRQQRALVSLALNVGEHNLAPSKTLEYLNKGDFQNAAREWLGFIHVNKQKVKGLARRRVEEVRGLIGDDIGKIMPDEYYRELRLWPFQDEGPQS